MQTGGTRARGGGGGEASEQTMCADCQGAYCAGIALTLAACVALDVCQNKKRAGKNVTLPAPLSAVMSPVRLRSCCLRARWRRVRSARPSGNTLVVTRSQGVGNPYRWPHDAGFQARVTQPDSVMPATIAGATVTDALSHA